MRGPDPLRPIDLTQEQEAELTKLSLKTTAPFAQVRRAKILLLAHQHKQYNNQHIADALHCGVSTVRKWRKRWTETKKLTDAPRSGAPRHFSP